MKTAFKPRWRDSKKRAFIKSPKRYKNAIQALAPVYDDGMVYGDFSSGSVLPAASDYYIDPILKPRISVEPEVIYTAPTLAHEPVYMAPVPVYVAPEPVYVAPEPAYVAPAPVYSAPVAEEMSSEEYQAYMAEVNAIAALQNPDVTYTPTDLTYTQPSAPSIIETPLPQVQFIGIDEFTAISNEGINIPSDANVVVVPVSEIYEPEIFQIIVDQQIAQPEKPIYDVVMEVIAPLSETPILKDAELKEEILFNQAVIEVKQEFPVLTINEAAVIVNDTKPIPVSDTNAIVASINNEIEKDDSILSEIIKDPVVKPVENKPLEVITNIVDKLIDKTTTTIDSGFMADDVKDRMAKDTNGMYIAGSVVVIGILALLFKK